MKIIIDVLMLVLMLFEFSKGYIEPIFHEIFGIALIVLVIIHLFLNRKYIKNIFTGKYNTSRTIMLIVNASFFITFFLTLVFGLLSSTELLTFLNIESLEIVKLHKVFSYISLILLAIHLGINFNSMLGKINKVIKSKIIVNIIDIVIVVYGIYAFIKLDIIKHLLGTYGFSVLEGNILLNIINYLSIILMISIITDKIYLYIKKGIRK